MTIKDLKQALKEQKKIFFGTSQTIKKLKTQKLDTVIVAFNCPQKLKESVLYYAKLSGTKVSVVEETNQSLGTICKKPFSINLLCF